MNCPMDKSMGFRIEANKCKNMLNSIIFYCERDWNITYPSKKKTFSG